MYQTYMFLKSNCLLWKPLKELILRLSFILLTDLASVSTVSWLAQTRKAAIFIHAHSIVLTRRASTLINIYVTAWAWESVRACAFEAIWRFTADSTIKARVLLTAIGLLITPFTRESAWTCASEAINFISASATVCAGTATAFLQETCAIYISLMGICRPSPLHIIKCYCGNT